MVAMFFSQAEPSELLINFGRGHHEEHFEFGPVVQEEMLIKEFLSRDLAALLFSGTEPFVQFCWKYEENFCSNDIEFGPVIQEEMLLKDISYIPLWWLLC